MSYLLGLCLFLHSQLVNAQDSLKYIDAKTLVTIGKAKVTKQWSQRIDSNETVTMPKVVQGLAKNSAGIAIIFETNSPVIAAKWTLAEDKYIANMTPIAHSGLDLYCLKDGKWQFVSPGRPEKGALDQSQIIIRRMDTTMKQFLLYLPLYNSVTNLSIGVNIKSVIKAPQKVAVDKAKRIVIYGSSIVQGASASRPGMAYPAMLQRKLGMDIINLGFSGNAKMEMEVAKYLVSIAADCYVLDCIPNQTPKQVSERALPFIKYLRDKRPNTPIILVETVIREHGYFDQQVGSNVRKQNENINKAYLQLLKENYKQIYYIPAMAFMGNDHEGTADGTHLTDLGFSRIAEAVFKELQKVLGRK